MNFRNNSIYVQRQTNRLFCNYRDFIKTYVDNIIMFNKTLNKHIDHLIKIFSFFEHMNITIKFIKIYLNYSSITLLSQKINSLRLIIAKKKKIKNYIKISFFDYAEVIQIVFKTYQMNAKLRFLLRTTVEFAADSQN